MPEIIKIRVSSKNIDTDNISLDSSLNMKGAEKFYDWVNNPGDAIIHIYHGDDVISVKAKEMADNINKLIIPFNNLKRNVSTYCIPIKNILKLKSAQYLYDQ